MGSLVYLGSSTKQPVTFRVMRETINAADGRRRIDTKEDLKF